MGKVIAFEELRQKAKNSSKKSKSKAKTAPDAAAIKLWRASLDFDDFIKKAIVEQHLSPEELAAMVAQRLGALIKTSEHSAKLLVFCTSILERVIIDQTAKGKGA